MQKTLNKYLACISMMALTFSLINYAMAATCDELPTCAELGYDKTNCSGAAIAIKCPFDLTKMKCLGKSCASLGYGQTQCSSDNMSLKCPFDPSKVMCIPIPTNFVEMSNCQVGDFVYAYTSNPGSYNYTKAMCSSRLYDQYNTSSMSTVNYLLLGIVVDSANHIAVSTLGSSFGSLNPAGKGKWDIHNRDFPNVPNIPNHTLAMADMDGYAHSYYIANEVGYDYNTFTQVLAASCYRMNDDGPPRARRFYLPALGELRKLGSIRSTMDKIDPYQGHDIGYWSSTPVSTTQAWLYDYTEGTDWEVDKLYTDGSQMKTKCFFEYY